MTLARRQALVTLPGNPFETLLLAVALLGGLAGLAADVSVPAIDALAPSLTLPFNAFLVAAGVIGLVAAVLDVPTCLLIERVAMGLLLVLLVIWAVLSIQAGSPAVTSVAVFAHVAAVGWRLWQNLRDLARVRRALDRAVEEIDPP